MDRLNIVAITLVACQISVCASAQQGARRMHHNGRGSKLAPASNVTSSSLAYDFPPPIIATWIGLAVTVKATSPTPKMAGSRLIAPRSCRRYVLPNSSSAAGTSNLREFAAVTGNVSVDKKSHRNSTLLSVPLESFLQEDSCAKPSKMMSASFEIVRFAGP